MYHGSVEAHFLVSVTKWPTPRRHFRAIAMKQSCNLFAKIYFLLKFQLSRWSLAPSGSYFPFWSVNKHGPLVGYFKIVYMVHAYNAQEQFSLVWSTSTNFKANYLDAHCPVWTADNPLCPSTLKRKSGCPSGINNFKSILKKYKIGALFDLRNRTPPLFSSAALAQRAK